MSQREVAQQCERVSYAYISRLEAGVRLASVRAIRELAAALGVTTAYLEYGWEADTEKAQLQRRIDNQADELRALRQALVVAESRATRYALQLRDYEREGKGSR